jgi:4-carboxymuconolactone decarboxylase
MEKMGWNKAYSDMNAGRLGDVFWDYTIENCFGNVWARPGLSLRDRELVTLGVLIAADNDGILSHFRNAPNVGITEPEMREIIFQALTYAGWPRGSAATKRFNSVLAEPGNKYGTQKAAAKAKPAPAKAAAKATAKPAAKSSAKAPAKSAAKPAAKTAAKAPARAKARG